MSRCGVCGVRGPDVQMELCADCARLRGREASQRGGLDQVWRRLEMACRDFEVRSMIVMEDYGGRPLVTMTREEAREYLLDLLETVEGSDDA